MIPTKIGPFVTAWTQFPDGKEREPETIEMGGALTDADEYRCIVDKKKRRGVMQNGKFECCYRLYHFPKRPIL